MGGGLGSARHSAGLVDIPTCETRGNRHARSIDFHPNRPAFGLCTSNGRNRCGGFRATFVAARVPFGVVVRHLHANDVQKSIGPAMTPCAHASFPNKNFSFQLRYRTLVQRS